MLRRIAPALAETPADRGDEDPALVDTGAMPDERIRGHELERRLGESLHDDERRLLALLIEGHSLKDIASTLALSYSTAGVRVHRLRAKIAKLLSTNDL
jgi:DNA-directed RNA polymerase specialized sigma24 family protein